MSQELYKLTKAADEDFENIIRYTLEKHGARQVRKYSSLLLKCLLNLARDQGHIRSMPDIHSDLCYILCEHHYIFGIKRKKEPMIIVAILHERMEMLQRISDRLE
jgi:plasmid stabilization system protein ParE